MGTPKRAEPSNDLERRFPMFDRPARLEWRAGFVSGCALFVRQLPVEKAGHDVEAAVAGASRLAWMGREPGVSAATQPTLFAFVDGLGRITMNMADRTSTLHFDEDQRRSAADDQVDFDALRTDVARDDAIPSVFEKSGGSVFARASEFLARIRHGSPISAPSTLMTFMTSMSSMSLMTFMTFMTHTMSQGSDVAVGRPIGPAG